MPNVEIEEDEMRAADLLSKLISTSENKKMKTTHKNSREQDKIKKQFKKCEIILDSNYCEYCVCMLIA